MGKAIMDKKTVKTIDVKRSQITKIDEEIFSLVAKRQDLASQIGALKRDINQADKDFAREKQCFKRAEILAQELRLPSEFASNLQSLLIELSLSRQQVERIKTAQRENKKRVAIIGGAGRMGGWFCRFFSDSGHHLLVIDKNKPIFDCDFQENLSEEIEKYDLIIVAAPIRQSIALLEQLSKFDLKNAVIFDVSSIKEPLTKNLFELKNKGYKITSLHPMFGPSVELLFGKHIIRTSLGVKEADLEAENLFGSTALKVVDMSFDKHDEIISYLLSLSHALNIAFGKTMQKSGFSFAYLNQFSSTTFMQQSQVAKKVASENPHLYYEIQALNSKNQAVLKIFMDTLQEITTLAENKNESAFAKLMTSAHEYLASQPSESS